MTLSNITSRLGAYEFLFWGATKNLGLHLAVIGGLFLLYNVWRPGALARFQNQPGKPYDRSRLLLEAALTLLNVGLVSTFSMFLFTTLMGLGVVRAYDPAAHSLAYAALSGLAFVLWSDFNRYFVHRTFHRFDFLFRMHRIHHESLVPSALTSPSAHPLDAFAIIFLAPLVPLCLFPVHPEVIGAYFFVTKLAAITNHSGYDLMTPVLGRLGLDRVFIFSGYHEKHHSQTNVNFGSYLAFWDSLFGTAAR